MTYLVEIDTRIARHCLHAGRLHAGLQPDGRSRRPGIISPKNLDLRLQLWEPFRLVQKELAVLPLPKSAPTSSDYLRLERLARVARNQGDMDATS